MANTAPVAFGAMDIPVLVAGQVSNLDPFHIGQIAGRQLPILAIIVLFWLMVMIDGWRGLKQSGISRRWFVCLDLIPYHKLYRS